MPARRYFVTAFFIVIIFSALSLLGDYLNVRFKFHQSYTGFVDFISFKLIFVIPFLLTAWIPLRIDLSLKLPLARTIVWMLLLLPEFFHKPPMDGEMYVVIGLGNGGLCSLYQTFCNVFFYPTNTYNYACMMAEVVIVDVFVFAIFEAAVIKAADVLSIALLRRIDGFGWSQSHTE